MVRARHSQNDRYWSPVNRHELVECKKAHCEKAIAWVGIIDGRCLPVVWIDGSVNGKNYLEKGLKDTVWQNVKHVPTRKEYWFQQDGAICHVTAQCSSFLRSKFGDRIISRNTQQHWPPYSLNLYHWTILFEANVRNMWRRRSPRTHVISVGAATYLQRTSMRKMVRHNRKRAAPCIDSLGGHFEQLL